ncbi:hypothetical protein [Methylomonas methanica]|uniref:hypothetical protein n=1 Tax=Methylomonas methanica TaxID=421 RepID=UPI0012F62CA5|nr:hypothetical protein [Methylomonas methanica]
MPKAAALTGIISAQARVLLTWPIGPSKKSISVCGLSSVEYVCRTLLIGAMAPIF